MSILGIPAGVPERGGAGASTRGGCEAPEPFTHCSLRPRCGQNLPARTFPGAAAGTDIAPLPPQVPPDDAAGVPAGQRLRIPRGVLDTPPAGSFPRIRATKKRQTVRSRRGAYESAEVLTEKRSRSVAAMAGAGSAPAAGALLSLPAASGCG